MKFDFLKKYFKTQRNIYLDYAAATPVHPEVFHAMQPYFSSVWANPSAVYKGGVCARDAVETARGNVAHMLRIRSHDVVFTGSGTESNNLALIGFVDALHAEGRAWSDMEILSIRIEHPSIREVLSLLKTRGVLVRYLALDGEGRIDMNDFEHALTEKTVLVTCAYVNSEIGVVQDLKRITRMVRAWNQVHNATVRVHTDASQAPLWLPCGFDTLGVDLMTLDAGKCYGPKGVGILAVRHGVKLAPQMLGGGQERGFRSSTENTALIVGCAYAFVRAQEGWVSRSEGVTSLRDTMIREIEHHIPEAFVNGSREHRVANNVHISIPGLDTEFAVISLDAAGISVSTKSACGSTSQSGSYVVREVYGDDARARATLRFTLGEETKMGDISTTIAVLKKHIDVMLPFKKTLADGAV